MSAHDLLNSFEEKIFNTRLAKHFITFCNQFNNFNSSGVQMLDYSY